MGSQRVGHDLVTEQQTVTGTVAGVVNTECLRKKQFFFLPRAYSVVGENDNEQAA